ncbi:MAG: exodeoxyribonuclease V subunit alpha [Planctomycetota bacterium]|jgi:exodeoxyribonuclease V alpha subunit|nr:exodeoxyribonuclease V subunit alpha [Planctomycetota bacterium]
MTILLTAEPPADLAPYLDAGIISPDDVAAVGVFVSLAARELPAAGEPPSSEPGGLDLLAWLALGLALRTPRDGHTCVDLARIADWFGGELPGNSSLAWPDDAATWKRALRSAGSLVGGLGDRAPFILDGERLYLARSLHEERAIADRLMGGSRAAIDAVAAGEPAAPRGRIRVLLGGPGTGKTTEVARRLIETFTADPLTRIALAAPTGKAAARMAEALRNRCLAEQAPQPVLDAIDAARPVTVHRLLKVRPQGSPRYRFNADHPLAYDLVVVDETSMLSSTLMYRLLDAISADTELLLVGDPDQLASVEAGSVLADIARAAAREGSPLATVTDRLVTRHRFGAEIGALADAILAGDAAGVLDLLETAGRQPAELFAGPVSWIEPGSPDFDSLIGEVVAQAERLGELARAGDAAAAVEAQKDLQVLSTHRSGWLGAAGWNATVEKRLGVFGGPPWYPGRPVMITRNTPALDLFNGDIGLILPAADSSGYASALGRQGLESAQAPTGMARREAAFPQGRSVRRVAVARLDEVATVHALTIHKSQGSEYRHAVVVLPERASRILSRELFYTGVTRAIERVTVVGTRDVIAAAVSRPIRRASGLADRL